MSKEYNQHKENQILSDIHNAASKVEIPDSVKPENMMQYIASKKSEGYFEGVDAEQENIKRKMRKRVIRRWTVAISSVAAVLAVVIIGVALMSRGAEVLTLRQLHAKMKQEDSAGVYVLSSYKDLAQYTMAENSKTEIMSFGDMLEEFLGGFGAMGASKGEAMNGATSDSMYGDSDIQFAPDKSEPPEYSDTNSRTEGVGEADVVKTDGEYIYYLYSENDTYKVGISKADGRDTKLVGKIILNEQLDSIFDNDNAKYGYVDMQELLIYEDKLVVIVEVEQKKFKDENGTTWKDVIYEYNTAMLVYDVHDVEDIKCISALYAEGNYKSCKYVDGYAYIFTEYYKRISDIQEKYSEEEAKEIFAPKICGEYMDCSDVYVAQAEDYNYYNIMVSIDINNPVSFTDTKAILGYDGNTNIYVSLNNIYIISNMYDEYITYIGEGTNEGNIVAANKAEIARVSYDKGIFKTTGRTEIAGELGDEFDIDEYNGYLRMAVSKKENKVYYWREKYQYFNGTEWLETSDWEAKNKWYNDNDSSVVYVLDSDLKLVGEVTLQKEEEVYGVRFDGDIAYVVTYRQTDPLFTVDLSDPTKPTVMGALKIPGFSEYLHVWDENTLLGIGYDDIRRVKISTYDISDKYNVTEKYVNTLDNVYGSPAIYNHKAVFITPQKALLGLMCQGYFKTGEYDYEYEQEYRIYEYTDDVFKEVIKYPVLDDTDYQNVRALYIGEYIYLIHPGVAVYVFDMNDYSNVASIQY